MTLCNRDRKNNVWVEGADENGEGGICLLDTIDQSQLVYVLQRDPKAREDLRRVTDDVSLINLADTVPELPKTNEGDDLQKEVNANDKAGSIPFYSIFRGQPPFAQ